MPLLLTLLMLGATPAPDTVVVCPEEFRQAFEPWLIHRREQGHVIQEVAPRPTCDETRNDIRLAAAGGKLRFIVLVGDVAQSVSGVSTPRIDPLRANPLLSIPTHYARATVNVHWGSEPLIASDNWYADLDDDELPDLAIGRLSVDSSAELALVVRKILDYEASQNFGNWRSRINFVAGIGGFGVLTDTILEAATRQVIAAGIPAAYTTTMTYGSWRSPYCPDPRRFHETTLDRLNEGSLFWVYIGHGQRWYLDQVHTPAGQHHILDIRDMAKLQCAQGSPIALFLACYTAAYDGHYDCLAEELLRKRGAPVAIVGGSRVTMPYAMSVLGAGMMEELFTKRRETLGEVLLYAKRSMVIGQESELRSSLDAVGAAMSPADLKAERKEHLHLINLVGDPLLRLRHPHAVEIEAAKEAVAGSQITVSGQSGLDGPCTVELILRRGRLKSPPPERPRFAENFTDLAAYQTVYDRANDVRLAVAETAVRAGRFMAALTIPQDAHGPCHVRVVVHGKGDYALGSSDIEIIDAPSAQR